MTYVVCPAIDAPGAGGVMVVLVAGTVGIVVPVARRAEANGWLASWPERAADSPSASASVDAARPPSGEDRVVVLTGLDTKGLEFDVVVLVEPAELLAESRRGRNDLYVALTRATQRLTVVHTAPLPPELRRLGG